MPGSCRCPWRRRSGAEKEGDGVLSDPWLTRRSTAGSARPEGKGWRRIRRRRSRVCGENRRRRRRLRRPRPDSRCEEDEGGEAVLGASSEEAGAARNGEGRRRSWRRARLLGGGREERESESNEREREGRGGVASRCLQEVDSSFVGKQEVATLAPAQDTQEVAVPAKKTRANLRIAP
jgi:hypothetical protein